MCKPPDVLAWLWILGSEAEDDDGGIWQQYLSAVMPDPDPV